MRMSKDPQADTVEMARLRVQDAIRNKRIKAADLARASNVAKTTLVGIEAPEWNPSVRTLSKLLAGLDALKIPTPKNSKR